MHYSGFRSGLQLRRVCAAPKRDFVRFLLANFEDRSIAKWAPRAYTPSPHLPPFQEVRQVEIEAGDCEGRLPSLLVLVRTSTFRLWALVFGLELRDFVFPSFRT